jgi:putative hemolysin
VSPVSGLLALAALLVAAWIRAAGTAVSQIPRADAHHDAAEGKRGARTIASLLEDRPRIAPSVGMICSVLLVGATVLAMAAMDTPLPPISLAGLVVVVVGIGDVLPRILGFVQSRRIAYASSPLLRLVMRVGGWAAERPPEDNGNGADNGEEEDDEGELAMISSVLRFSDTVVREVMTPRLDMITIDADAGTEEMAAAAIEHGFSRFPVTEGDDVVGVLLVKDLLSGLVGRTGSVTARALMRPAVFIPEVKPISELLTEMRANKTHMCIVVDEFGDIAGLVTIEDLLEELVGEISDETDEEEIWVEPLGEGQWRVDARLSVEDLAQLLQTELPEGDWDTVGGLILGLAERVPEEAESFVVDSARLQVTRMQGRRVAEVLVTSISAEEAGE